MNPITSMRRAEPVVPELTNAPGHRSQALLRAVVAQFDPVGNPRYQRDEGGTYCNIFVSDVTDALGAAIPHRIQDEKVPGGVRELNVNNTIAWLEHESSWTEVDERDAAARASLGRPVVAVWKNPAPGGHGHIAILLPPRAGAVRIAQAGATNFYDVPLGSGFGTRTPIRFFSHP